VFVSKLNANGTALVYSTYLGGGNTDAGFGITLDSSGNAYITGVTYSSDFPTTPSAFDTSYNGYYDVFVSKVDSPGTALIYSTYLGGGYHDFDYSIAIDGSGNAYITGFTASTDFPTTLDAFDTTLHSSGYVDTVFVSKLNPSGTALVYSTYLGGSDSDWGSGIAVNSDKEAYVTGNTYSTNFLPEADSRDTSRKPSDTWISLQYGFSGLIVTFC
jgi:hypothetical protein